MKRESTSAGADASRSRLDRASRPATSWRRGVRKRSSSGGSRERPRTRAEIAKALVVGRNRGGGRRGRNVVRAGGPEPPGTPPGGPDDARRARAAEAHGICDG